MFQVFLIIFWQQFGYKVGVGRCTTPQSAQPTAPPQGEGNSGCIRGGGASGTDESVPYKICGGCGRN